MSKKAVSAGPTLIVDGQHATSKLAAALDDARADGFRAGYVVGHRDGFIEAGSIDWERSSTCAEQAWSAPRKIDRVGFAERIVAYGSYETHAARILPEKNPKKPRTWVTACLRGVSRLAPEEFELTRSEPTCAACAAFLKELG